MEVQTFFLQLLAILVAARLFAEIAVRLQAPAVIGELCAGIIIGPSLLGWVAPSETIKLLAEIGIILLLFEVGVQTDLRRLVQAGRQSVIIAVAGIIGPLSLGFVVAYVGFDLPVLVALFIGGTLTATSIGITVRVLSDLKRQHAYEGQVVLGAAVIDDVVGVVLLAILYDFSTKGDVDTAHAGGIILLIAAFFIIAPVVAKLFSYALRRVHDNSTVPGLIPTAIISLVLFFAWLAHAIGAPEILGGFAAGLALSRRFFLPFGIAVRRDSKFVHRIETEMRPIIRLFTPIFFVMVGLSLSLHEIDWGSPFIWLFSVVMLLVAVAGKFLGVLFLRDPWPTRLVIGMAMTPRGEVGLIFAELGRVSGILNNEVYAGMIIVIALTTLLAPFALKVLYGKLADSLPNVS